MRCVMIESPVKAIVTGPFDCPTAGAWPAIATPSNTTPIAKRFFITPPSGLSIAILEKKTGPPLLK